MNNCGSARPSAPIPHAKSARVAFAANTAYRLDASLLGARLNVADRFERVRSIKLF